MNFNGLGLFDLHGITFLFIGCQHCNEKGAVNGKCDEQTGQCMCKKGYTSGGCYVCNPGKYGIHCDKGESKLIPSKDKLNLIEY